jgi:hypothetical protein
MAGQRGSDEFTLRELFSNPVLKALARGMSVDKIGRLFARCAADSVVIGGLIIKRIGNEHHATLWRLEKVNFTPLKLPATIAAPSAVLVESLSR